jgi:hypothetical protein
MANENLEEKHEIWIDIENKIISFQHNANYINKQFKDHEALYDYVLWRTKAGFRVK